MKQNIIITIFFVILLGLQGCSNFLTVDIPDSLTKKEYWKSKDHAKAEIGRAHV